MPEEAVWRANWREWWREVRMAARPAIAPYAERGFDKPWKWDRPFGLMVGRAMALRAGTHSLAVRAEAIIARADELAAWPDADLDGHIADLGRQILRHGIARADLVDECFACIREVTGRALGMRHFAVQLVGGLVMLDGALAEMATGEGKTITALLPAITAAMARIPVHVFTVNDYLAARDADKLAPVYRRFGLTLGLIVHGQDNAERRAAYRADVVYGTNKEITFDYLRDQTALGRQRGLARRLVGELFLGRAAAPLLLRGLHFAIVDEADSIFIDEARTPLILSAELPADDDGLYLAALELAAQLHPGRHYHLREAERLVELTERGKQTVEQLAQGLPHSRWRIRQAREELATQALSARHLFLRDRDYIVLDGKVQIVDESTGRVMADRSWEGGLHQLIECKEQVELSGTRNTMARITYQRFFRRYRRLAGMSGTMREVAGELWADYDVRVRLVATNRPSQRADWPALLCRTAADKWQAVAASVAAIRAETPERAVLVGTRSVAESEAVAEALAAAHIPCRVLNARQDAEEAEIIAAAGEPGAVTVATNMAGRGTDIELAAAARAAGGLHVILTAFHETKRIDRQLQGRAGRQGDPGSSQAITALDDELYTLFAPRLAKLLAANAGSWPLTGWRVALLRRRAQGRAERHHAAIRRQTELAEEKLQETIAFSGGN